MTPKQRNQTAGQYPLSRPAKHWGLSLATVKRCCNASKPPQ